MQDAKYLVDIDQDHLPALTVGMYRAFLAQGRPGAEALQVYLHLLFTYRLQKTNCVRATNRYIQAGLHIGEKRVERAKRLLRTMGLAETVRRKDSAGRIEKAYVRLNLLPNPGPKNSIPAESAAMDSIPAKTIPAVFHGVDRDPKCLKKKSKMLEEQRRGKTPPYDPNEELPA